MRERHLAVYDVQTINDVTRLHRCAGVMIGGRLGSGVSVWGELHPGGDEATLRYELTFSLLRSGGTVGNGDHDDDEDNEDDDINGVGLDFELWVEGGGNDAAAAMATTTPAMTGGGTPTTVAITATTTTAVAVASGANTTAGTPPPPRL